MNDQDREIIAKQFKVVCLKCGSDKALIDVDPGRVYSEYSSDSPTLSITCPTCKANDVIVYL